MIEGEGISFAYQQFDASTQQVESQPALNQVNIHIKAGEFIAIVGHNGSGKSTLARHFNGLLLPSEGSLILHGVDVKDEDRIWEIRQKSGMVFQNPDNQIIGTIVEEDVGFGPENLGVKTQEIWERIESSLKSVGMLEFRHYSPDRLSGGQKQRVAIASVLAMKPSCIILDEATAMLDPRGRKEVIDTITQINQEEGVTVILITHFMEEVLKADRVYVMDKGKVCMEGTPREIFSRGEELLRFGLELPEATRFAIALKQAGLPLKEDILYEEELIEEIEKLCNLK